MRLPRILVEEVLKGGHSVHSANISLKYLRSPDDSKAYTFVISAKTAKLAVTRNLLKRRGRSVVDDIQSRFKSGFKCVFIFKPGAVKLEFPALKQEIIDILLKAKII